MSGWILAKYALALAGIALVLLSDRLQLPWLGYSGLAIIVAAFLLRFLQRKYAPSGEDSPTD